MTGLGRVARFLRVDALNRVWRASLQGLLATALVAGWEAGRQLLGEGPVDWRRVAWVGTSAAGVVVSTYMLTALRTGRLEPIPLRLDALVRAGRTLLAGAVTTAAAAAVEVVLAAVTSGGFDPARLATTALTAGGLALIAYLHRTRLDPSSLPSATPPSPPPTYARGGPVSRTDVDLVTQADESARRSDPLG